MTAVFGVPLDKTENRWRLDQHDKVISRCLGLVPRTQTRNVPFAGGRSVNKTMRQYAQQLSQYRQLLDQSFLGQPGLFEPSTVVQYAEQARTQTAWANQAIASAAAAPPARESFDQLIAHRQAVARQLSALSLLEKSQVENYLSLCQTEMAPVIAEGWLRQAGGTEKNVAAAKLLLVARALEAPTKTAWDEKYNRLVESLVAEPLQAGIAKLNAVPATLPDVLQLAAMKAPFDTSFGDSRTTPAVEAARDEYASARIRVLSGALPSWRQEVDRVPVAAAAAAAKHHELDSLFPAKDDRSSPLFAQYGTPLRVKEEQLRALIAAERQPAPPPGDRRQQNGALTPGNFSARGLRNEATLSKLFLGDFVNIDVDPEQSPFRILFRQYLDSYACKCVPNPTPPGVVEMGRPRRTWKHSGLEMPPNR